MKLAGADATPKTSLLAFVCVDSEDCLAANHGADIAWYTHDMNIVQTWARF